MLLTVWIVVAVLALLTLGVLGYQLLGAAGRLGRELRGLERDVQPVLADLQAAAARAAAVKAAAGEARTHGADPSPTADRPVPPGLPA